MPNTRDERRLAYLDSQDFTGLFIEELGWDRAAAKPQEISVDDRTFTLKPVAEYRGVRIWECDQVPDSRTQRAIDMQLKKNSAERLVIFHDYIHQEWKWPISSDSRGRGTSRIVSHEHFRGRKTQALLQRLEMVRIGLEESPSVVEVVGRLRRAFDADAVTKSFYTNFAEESESLSSSIRGISDESERDWYAALLLNRLMFIYFLQRKGFMDSDRDYLRDRLLEVRSIAGPDNFFRFYSDFLLPLFHEGLGSPDRPIEGPDLGSLIGDIPYVNGGIFTTHPLEATHQIQVPDKAFESIFDLFDQYQWHLDDRPTGDPNEINPDVLGYIFEQFINNKEMGAYYTKEDVTYFMTALTLVPAFLESLTERTGINPWLLPNENPERYVWASVTHGTDEPLPQIVADEALSFPRPHWADLAPETHGFSGESWWEVQARRDRARVLHGRLANGEISSTVTAISANINLEAVAIDVIDRIDSAEDVLAAWRALSEIRFIDPTCGSGAFLFAAIKVLESLYLAILDAADRHVRTSGHISLQELMSAASKHPNRRYFVLKHAAINNLYGVDLMNEAVEIARLRLFLKLVSAVEHREDLEPLPDLDFNIKAGNILVGALDASSLTRTATDIFSTAGLDGVEEAAAHIVEQYRAFQQATEAGDTEGVGERRAALRESFDTVREKVDRYFWASISGSTGDFVEWKSTHQPFHWFIEFPEVFQSGGFSCAVGNPPYVAKRKVKGYSYSGFATDDAPDIYAPCVERAADICSPDGYMAMIVPISSQFSRDFVSLRDRLDQSCRTLWVSTFSRNPAALFDAGVGVRSTIMIAARGVEKPVHYVTKTHRWYEEFRPALFETLAYVPLPNTFVTDEQSWSRMVTDSNVEMVRLLRERSTGTLANCIDSKGAYQVGAKSIALYWLSCYDKEPPSFDLSGKPIPHTAVKGMRFASERDQMIALAILSSKIALFWWATHGDDFNVTTGVLTSLPINPRDLAKDDADRLEVLGRAVAMRLPKHVQFTKYAGKWMGNYVLPEIRDLTDEIDGFLASAYGYQHCLPDLELFYATFFKPTGERPGTLREVPNFAETPS